MRSNKRKPAERCEYCGESLRRGRVRVYRRRGSRHVLFERVPALICRSCGHRIFESDAVEAMEHALDRPRAGKRTARLTIVSP